MMMAAVLVCAAGVLVSACASRDLSPHPVDEGRDESLPAGYLPLAIEALRPRSMLHAPLHLEVKRATNSSLGESVIRREVKP